MPSTKVKRLKRLPTPDKKSGKVLVRKKPKSAGDNVITKRKLKSAKVSKPLQKALRILNPKGKGMRKAKKPDKQDTSLVDNKAKDFSAEVAPGDHRTFKGFATTGLGDILEVTGVTVSRWAASGLLPKPIFQSGRAQVYHVEEARAIYRIMVPHLQAHSGYRPDHTEVRQRLFDDIAAVRKGLFPTK